MTKPDKLTALTALATSLNDGDRVMAYIDLLDAARMLLTLAHEHATKRQAFDDVTRAAVLFALLGDCRRNVPDIPTKGD